MLLRTLEGDASNDLDPNHLSYTGAAVLVGDITVFDPIAGQELTLEGIFGMNFLTASADLITGGPLGLEIAALAGGAFDWVVFDEPNGRMGLTLAVPEPASLAFIAIGSALVLRRRRSL
jgi:hypothetical protein